MTTKFTIATGRALVPVTDLKTPCWARSVGGSLFFFGTDGHVTHIATDDELAGDAPVCELQTTDVQDSFASSDVFEVVDVAITLHIPGTMPS